MVNTLNGLEKAVDINERMSTLDARISKCIEDALAPLLQEIRAFCLIRGRRQHDSHAPGAQPTAHINNTNSHNLNTEPTTPLHPSPAQDAAHIKVELIGQRQEDAKTLAPDSQLKYSPPLLAYPVLETTLLLPSQEDVKPHAYDSQPKDLVTFSAENKTVVLYPAPATDDSTKPEISSPTSEGHHHTSNPPPPQPLPLALPQQ